MRRLLALVLGVSAVAVSGCGAQEASLVKSAFSKDIGSANVTIALSMTSKAGDTALGLTGPYRSNGKGKLPSVDFNLNLAGPTASPIEAELISTGDDAFVIYQGETYQVGKDKLAQLGMMGGTNPSATDIAKLMAKMQDWFPESDTQANATLNDEEVTRLTGKLDLSEALKDMKSLAQQPGASGFEGLNQLSGGDLAQIAKQVSDPRFTVDIAKSDGKLRRIAARMKVDDGSSEGTVSFSLQLKDVDKPVNITAPASGKPIEQLMQRLQQDFGGSQSDAARSTIS
jgi:hypothetical protein